MSSCEMQRSIITLPLSMPYQATLVHTTVAHNIVAQHSAAQVETTHNDSAVDMTIVCLSVTSCCTNGRVTFSQRREQKTGFLRILVLNAPVACSSLKC